MSESIGRVVIPDDGIEGGLLRFVAEQVAVEPRGLTAEENLIESGRVDSLGLLQILGFVEAEYHVDLMSGGDPADLQSVIALAAAIRRETTRRRAAEGA